MSIPAPRIVTRHEWGARAPAGRRTIALPTPRLWIHHSAGAGDDGPQDVRGIQRYHMDVKGWTDIAYSFLVDDDGTIYEGRGVGIAGGHTEGDNSRSHAICFMGNYEVQRPADAALDSAAHLAAYGRQQGWWGTVTGGHRDAPGASTACPGRHLQAVLDRIRTYDGTNEEDDLMGRGDEIVANQWREAIATARARDAEMQTAWKSRRIQVDLLEAVLVATGGDFGRLSAETKDYLEATKNATDAPEPVHERAIVAHARAAIGDQKVDAILDELPAAA